jgi:hypothetical protein
MNAPDERRSRRVDFDRVAAAGLRNIEAVCRGLLPDGRREGAEWVARNPRRDDRRLGSFKVNVATAKWGDFAAGAFGGDAVALVAYLLDLSQREAAIRLAETLGISPFEGG